MGNEFACSCNKLSLLNLVFKIQKVIFQVHEQMEKRIFSHEPSSSPPSSSSSMMHHHHHETRGFSRARKRKSDITTTRWEENIWDDEKKPVESGNVAINDENKIPCMWTTCDAFGLVPWRPFINLKKCFTSFLCNDVRARTQGAYSRHPLRGFYGSDSEISWRSESSSSGNKVFILFSQTFNLSTKQPTRGVTTDACTTASTTKASQSFQCQRMKLYGRIVRWSVRACQSETSWNSTRSPEASLASRSDTRDER